MDAIQIGKKFFSWRDYTPIPLIILILIFHKSTVLSATLGMVFIFLGELIRIYSVAFIGGVSRTRSDSTGQKLVTEGAFSFVRNPLYVGNFFITLGVAVFAGALWLVALAVVLFAVQYYFIVKYEESILKGKFASDYTEYKRRVPAWLPKRFPRLKDLTWPQSFTPAIQSESRTFTAIFCMLLVLVLLSLACSPKRTTADADLSVDDDTLEAAAGRANNVFALKLYNETKKKGNNHILAPFSITSSLAMVYDGTAGATAKEFTQVLEYEEDKILTHKGYQILNQRFDATLEKQGYVLNVANRLYPAIRSDLKLKDSFLGNQKMFYLTEVLPQNYATDAENSRQKINQWVLDRTKLPELIPAGGIKEDTSLVLVNALYLKADWQVRFRQVSPSDQAPFMNETGAAGSALLMKVTDNLLYMENPEVGFQALELPIQTKGDPEAKISMLVLLPTAGKSLLDLEKNLNLEILDDVDEKLKGARVAVSLPKFTHTQAFDLSANLQSMGVKLAFDKRQADFSEMATYPKDKPPHLSKVFHKAFVDVNESGLEASGATAAIVVQVTGGIIDETPPVVFKADHPFLFLIRDDKTKTILFMGRYAKA